LRRLEARYPFGPYAQQSQINVAYCHWKDGELAQAITAVDRFLQLHPGHPSVDYAYYLKGLITFNDNMGFMGKLTGQDLSERDPRAARDAFEAFKTLTTRFPQSKYTPDASRSHALHCEFIGGQRCKHSSLLLPPWRLL
jgi:outer membrane protein assembly factor BamD